jgi:electron transport complex protein RnfD
MPLIERISQPTPFGKGSFGKRKRQATYALHPDYISREESGAEAPKKNFLRKGTGS